MMKILKNKNGMTLVEIVAGMLLLAIVTMAVSAVVSPMLKTQARANELAECNALLDNIANPIINDISQSTTKPAIQDDGREIWLTINNLHDVKYAVSQGAITAGSTTKSGILVRNESSVLPIQFYKNWRAYFSCREATSSAIAYVLTVTLLDENSEVISKDYAVNPLALNQYNTP